MGHSGSYKELGPKTPKIGPVFRNELNGGESLEAEDWSRTTVEEMMIAAEEVLKSRNEQSKTD